MTTGKPHRCKLPQDGAGGTDQTRSRAQSSATEQHDVDDDDQKIAVRREEANERGRRASGNQESAQKSHAKEAFCSGVLGPRNRDPIAADDGEQGRQKLSARV